MRESRYNIWHERGDAAYVYNGISGALLRVPSDERDSLARFLAGDDRVACDPDVLVHMAQGAMLVPDDLDEIALLTERYRVSRWDATSFALTIVTSLGCNFDCPYCFEAKHPSLIDAETEDLVLAVLDDQLPKIRRFNVTWFGGEPLVGKRALLTLSDRFTERCDQAGVQYSAAVITNGYLLDESTCAELAGRRVRSLQVGLDGPPDVHDRMRPLASGRGTFRQIVSNLRHAVRYLPVTVRVNIDAENAGRVGELFEILAAEGLAGQLTVYPGQLVTGDGNPAAPSAKYATACLASREFAHARLTFFELAARYGFAAGSLPVPARAPCTAVRANELVVGSRGELYKCWDSVGDRQEVIGHIRNYRDTNGRMAKWLAYNPFENAECRGCIALPVCMGGCARHAFSNLEYENRCGTFRHTYAQEVARFIESADALSITGRTHTGGPPAAVMPSRTLPHQP
jgi:uncharacterized protein